MLRFLGVPSWRVAFRFLGLFSPCWFARSCQAILGFHIAGVTGFAGIAEADRVGKSNAFAGAGGVPKFNGNV